MSYQSNIRRRGAVYQARVALPLELVRARAEAGLKKVLEITKSLRTKDQKEAHRIGPAVIERIRAEFDQELAQLAGKTVIKNTIGRLHSPSELEVDVAVWNTVESDLNADEELRINPPNEERVREVLAIANERVIADMRAGLLDGVADDSERRLLATLVDRNEARIRANFEKSAKRSGGGVSSENRAQLREEWASAIRRSNATEVFGFQAEQLIRQHRWDILPDSPQFRRLTHQLRAANLRVLSAIVARERGDTMSETANPSTPSHIAASMRVSAARKAKPGETLLDLLERYLIEQGPRLSPETIAGKRTTVKLFSEFVGAERNVKTITRDDSREFKLMLVDMPRTAQNIAEFKGKSFKEIIKLNRQENRTRISSKTVNNYLTSLGAFFGWLEANSHFVERDVTRGLLLSIDKSVGRRYPYSDDELNQIFSLPVFTGADSTKKLSIRGSKQIADWHFWIPVICLYSGARLGEIAQLRTSDVKEVRGHWSFHITDEGEGQETKTIGSVRVVPIHPELIRLGFLGYHCRVMSTEKVQLFPELVPNEHGRFGAPVSKWWRKYLKRFGIKGNAYRFRHTFMAALRKAGVLNNEIGPIVGHKEGSMTERYAESVPQVTVDRRAAIVASATFPINIVPR